MKDVDLYAEITHAYSWYAGSISLRDWANISRIGFQFHGSVPGCLGGRPPTVRRGVKLNCK